jgi:hypothetical protein
MGDVLSDTPKDLISKVFLEEKLFKTWYRGRTVLIGDGNVLRFLNIIYDQTFQPHESDTLTLCESLSLSLPQSM